MEQEAPPPRNGGAVAVAAGIVLSRISGLVRERVIAHYLGLSAAAAALRAALRIPQLLQSLLGDGALSSAFIPVYARLLAEGRDEEAARVARLTGALLALLVSSAAVLGLLAADPLVGLLAPGFEPGTRDLTVRLLQIVFPATALVVMASWCVGVLACHRRFFLSHASPVLWNIAIIATAIVAGTRFAGDDADLATWVAWGALLGSAAQVLVQLPSAVRLTRSPASRPSTSVDPRGSLRTVLWALVPNVITRGSVQISVYIDQIIASFLGEMIVAATFNAQTLYVLPIAVFGLAITASELPEMARATGDPTARANHVKDRMRSSLRWTVFFVVPSAVAFIVIGESIVRFIFETGRFGATDTEVVWLLLIGYSLGLVPAALARLLSSSFYALGDQGPPLRAALVRVGITAVVGYAIAFPLRDALGFTALTAAFAIAALSALTAWIQYAMLRGELAARIGDLPLPTRLAFGALAAAALAGGLGWGAAHLLEAIGLRSSIAAVVAIAVFGGAYLGAMALAKVPEATGTVRRVMRRRT